MSEISVPTDGVPLSIREWRNYCVAKMTIVPADHFLPNTPHTNINAEAGQKTISTQPLILQTAEMILACRILAVAITAPRFMRRY